MQRADSSTGVIYQAGLSLAHVLLLPLQHDCCSHPRRVSLDLNCVDCITRDILRSCNGRMLYQAASLVTVMERENT